MADEKMKNILKLIDVVSEKELIVPDGALVEDDAKIDLHIKAFKRIFKNGIGDKDAEEAYAKNFNTLLGLEDAHQEIKNTAINKILQSFKDAEINDELDKEEKEKVLNLFKAILDFYEGDDKLEEFENLKTQVEKNKEEPKDEPKVEPNDGSKGESKVIFEEGDRCYRVKIEDNGSVNVNYLGPRDNVKNPEDGAGAGGGGRKRKSRRRKSKRKLRRKSKRNLRRKNRKSRRKNRKSRRKSIKR